MIVAATEAPESARAAFGRAVHTLMEVAVDRAADRVVSRLDDVADRLEQVAAPAGLAADRDAVPDVVPEDVVDVGPAGGGRRRSRRGWLGRLLQRITSGLRKLLRALAQKAFDLAANALDRLQHTVDEIAARPDVTARAPLGAVRAFLAGENPIWGAIKAGFSGLSPGAKVGLIVLLVLAVLLLPVTVLLVLLAVLVIALVLWVKHLRKAAA